MRSRRSMFAPLLHPWFLTAPVFVTASAFGCQPLPSKTAASGAAPATPDGTAAAPNAAPAPAPKPHEVDKQAARSSARNWLALIDQTHYGESWEKAAPVFQSRLTKEQWEGAVKGARAPFGDLASRQFRAAEYKDSLPGAPTGEYVVVYYDSVFSDKPAATESVTLAKTDADDWRAIGYFLR